MHHCLSLPEIILEIVENVSDFGEINPSRQTLAALARTCTAFQEAALDELWRFQSGFLNLMKCLPPSKLYKKRRKWVYNIIFIVKKISNSYLM